MKTEGLRLKLLTRTRQAHKTHNRAGSAEYYKDIQESTDLEDRIKVILLSSQHRRDSEQHKLNVIDEQTDGGETKPTR